MQTQGSIDLAEDLAPTRPDMCRTCYAHLVIDFDVRLVTGLAGQ